MRAHGSPYPVNSQETGAEHSLGGPSCSQNYIILPHSPWGTQTPRPPSATSAAQKSSPPERTDTTRSATGPYRAELLGSSCPCCRGDTFDSLLRLSERKSPTQLGVEAKKPAPRDGRPVALPATLRSRRWRLVPVF